MLSPKELKSAIAKVDKAAGQITKHLDSIDGQLAQLTELRDSLQMVLDGTDTPAMVERAPKETKVKADSKKAAKDEKPSKKRN